MITISFSFLLNFSSNCKSWSVVLWIVVPCIWKPFLGGIIIVAAPCFFHVASVSSCVFSCRIQFVGSGPSLMALAVASYSIILCLAIVSMERVSSSGGTPNSLAMSFRLCQAPSSRILSRVVKRARSYFFGFLFNG